MRHIGFNAMTCAALVMGTCGVLFLALRHTIVGCFGPEAPVAELAAALVTCFIIWSALMLWTCSACGFVFPPVGTAWIALNSGRTNTGMWPLIKAPLFGLLYVAWAFGRSSGSIRGFPSGSFAEMLWAVFLLAGLVLPTFNSGTITVSTGALDFAAGLSNEGSIAGSARIELNPPPLFPRAEPLTLTLHGISGLKYRVEATADLMTWEEIALTHAPARTFQLLDPGAVGATLRYYRATVAPSN